MSSAGTFGTEAGERCEELLDESLYLTFPASDPVAVTFAIAARDRYVEEERVLAAAAGDDLVRRYQRGNRAAFRRNPFRLIGAYLICFHYKAGKAFLGMRPDDSMLESLAELFKQWWSGKGSLDEVFGLVGTRRGRKSVRENYRLQLQAFVAEALYDELRASDLLQKQAVGEVARLLNIKESKAHALIFRHRKVKKSSFS